MVGIVIAVFALKCLDVCVANSIDKLGDTMFSNKQE